MDESKLEVKTLKISSQSQVTIPKSLREKLKLEPGDRVTFVIGEGVAILYPKAKGVTEYTKGIAKGIYDCYGGVDAYIKKARKDWERRIASF